MKPVGAGLPTGRQVCANEVRVVLLYTYTSYGSNLVVLAFERTDNMIIYI